MQQKNANTQGLVEEIQGCRVLDIGLEGMAECLDVGPKACPYAMPFGYAFLCRHPRLDKIIERTQAEKVHPSDRL